MFINIPDSNHDAVDTALNRLADLYPQKYAELLQEERFQGLANFIVECHPGVGVKIPNIKLFRELSGLGLADSKRMIETAADSKRMIETANELREDAQNAFWDSTTVRYGPDDDNDPLLY
jgi:ribosomal protein L7/L12